MKKIKIATDFNDAPGGRYRKDGSASGQEFREDFLMPSLKDGVVQVDLDGTFGYPISFLDEAFRDLGGYSEKIVFVSEEEPSLPGRIRKIMGAGDTDETLTLRCACYSTEHALHFHFDRENNEIYTEVLMRNWRGFFKRLWVAVKYLFGYKCRFGHFDCFEMRPEDARTLQVILGEFLAQHEERKE